MRRWLTMLAFTAAMAACSDSSGPGTSATINVDDDFFSPSDVTVDVGTTVKWVWVGSRTHNVVFSGGSIASPDQASGSWTYTFSAEGTYSYRCTHHNETGEIQVR